jgi:hypothetical protein
MDNNGIGSNLRIRTIELKKKIPVSARCEIDDKDRWVLLFPHRGKLGDAKEQNAQPDEENTQADRATPIESEPKIHVTSPFIKSISVGH